MKWNNRRRFCLLIMVLTVILTTIVWLTMPDPVLNGIQVRNGVQNCTYMPKTELCVRAVCGPLVYCLIWDRLIIRIDRRIAAEPRLNSLRLRRALINFLGLLLTSVGVWGNLLILIWNM